jgi:hypothetical protein
MTSPVSDYSRLPQELKQLKRWCVAAPDKSPYVAQGDSLRRVSIHEIDSLHTFEDACAIGAYFGAPIGFILCAQDGVSCIDLDVKDASSVDKNGQPYEPTLWTTQEQLNRYHDIVHHFETYGELSLSGRGAHLWLLGSIGKGARRDGIEVYSQERFIICTGNSFKDIYYQFENSRISVSTLDGVLPLQANRVDSLVQMVNEMHAVDHRASELEELEEEHTDREIFEMATSAANADKFEGLYGGNWQDLGYPSQSEADLSFMSMLTFYSKSNEQCRRLFRMSGLGKRDKAVRDNKYLDRTLKLIRGRQATEEAAIAHGNSLVHSLVAQLQQETANQLNAAPLAVQAVELPKPADHTELTWPPGMAGAIAGFIYHSSQRPVREVSIVAALGLLAGICGKAFCLDDTGLNVYITLIARSGVGKEGMHSGITKLLHKVSTKIPIATRFVTFTDFVSGPALMKFCASNPSFVNVAGEWGRKLKRMSLEDGREGPMQQLRTLMTNLYSKSGPTSVAGGLSYSNKDNDVDSVSGVNFSLIGESTPGTFYESLTPGMMEDGFLSRFTTVEYTGERPPHNEHKITEPEPHLVDAICGLCTHAATLISRYEYQNVTYTAEAKILSREFDRECDTHINSYEDESFRQMWNRAHLKSLRIAALFAVADNWLTPTITLEHMSWAIGLIRRDISVVTKHLTEGDVGTDDGTRDRKLLQILREFITTNLAPSYRIPKQMQADHIVPKRFLQTRIQRITAFTKHKIGVNVGLDASIKSLIENGYLMEIDKLKVFKMYGKTERCFKILDL